jgi:hypothetical protein
MLELRQFPALPNLRHRASWCSLAKPNRNESE